jgi:hypothetical protein
MGKTPDRRGVCQPECVWGVEVPVPAPSLQQLQRPGIGGKIVAGRQAAGTLSVEGQEKGPRRS